MARFDTTGLEDLVRQMRKLGQDEGPVAEEMVNAAVDVIKDEWKKAAEAHGHVETGSMINNIRPAGKAPVRAGNLIYRDVYPQGKDAKGVSNAKKASILHYGKSNLQGDYWVDEADKNSAEPVQAVCEAIWDRFIQEHG